MEKFKDKKILFVVDNMSFGGAQKLVLDQVNYLHKEGFNVSLLTVITEKRANFLDRVQIPKEKIYSFDTGLNIASIFRIRSFLQRKPFDFVISNLFYSNSVIRLASLTLFRKPKVIVYEHNVYTSEKTKKHLLVDRFLSFVTLKIIAVSAEVENYLVQSGGIRRNKISVVKNGIEFPIIDTGAASRKRKELGIGDSQILVVSVGNVDYQKGHDLLLEAANIVNSQNKNYIYLICGRTKNQEIISKLETKVKEYGLESNFKLLGDRADVLEIVAAADIFAMPSRWEGLSIALLEAMSLKKAIIVSDIPSMQRLVQDEVNGLKFNLENVNDLAEKKKIVAQ
jgi:glycosyltransferase involved in cell wall biosynthesis